MTRFEARVIGIAGGSGSGKTTFAQQLGAAIEASAGDATCAILSQDHYYFDQSASFRGDGENVNFDHPDALDFGLLATHLEQLRRGEPIEVPIYEFATHKRKSETEAFPARRFIVLDGTLILSQPRVRERIDVGVYIDTPEEVRLERRLRRDTTERGRTREGVLKQFERQVKPMHDLFVETSKIQADHVIGGVHPFEAAMPEWARVLAGLK